MIDVALISLACSALGLVITLYVANRARKAQHDIKRIEWNYKLSEQRLARLMALFSAAESLRIEVRRLELRIASRDSQSFKSADDERQKLSIVPVDERFSELIERWSEAKASSQTAPLGDALFSTNMRSSLQNLTTLLSKYASEPRLVGSNASLAHRTQGDIDRLLAELDRLPDLVKKSINHIADSPNAA